MNNEFIFITEQLQKATCPEEVFGCGSRSNTEPLTWDGDLKTIFHLMAKAIHPDHNNNMPEAHEAFAALSQFRDAAIAALKDGTYGKRIPIPSRVPITIQGYIVKSVLATGDIADLRIAALGKESVIIKSARQRQDNDLLTVENNCLRILHEYLENHHSTHIDCIPKVIDSFLLDDGSALPKRRVNVLPYFEGFYNVAQIRQKLPLGVDGRTLGWMWRRMLTLLDWTHRTGYVHGAILPPHVMFYPDNTSSHSSKIDKRQHSVRLVDWCYAINTKTRSKLSCWCPDYAAFYPPEVIQKGVVVPQTDLYMAAKTMVYLAGGDVATNQIPPTVPVAVQKKLTECLTPNASGRPQDTLKYFEEFSTVLTKEFGKPKWHDFVLP